MTTAEKARITALRNAGQGYKRIAQDLGLSENSVKTYCRRNGLVTLPQNEEQAAIRATEQACRFCGIPVAQYRHQRRDRSLYWNRGR